MEMVRGFLRVFYFGLRSGGFVFVGFRLVMEMMDIRSIGGFGIFFLEELGVRFLFLLNCFLD